MYNTLQRHATFSSIEHAVIKISYSRQQSQTDCNLCTTFNVLDQAYEQGKTRKGEGRGGWSKWRLGRAMADKSEQYRAQPSRAGQGRAGEDRTFTAGQGRHGRQARQSRDVRVRQGRAGQSRAWPSGQGRTGPLAHGRQDTTAREKKAPSISIPRSDVPAIPKLIPDIALLHGSLIAAYVHWLLLPGRRGMLGCRGSEC